MKVGYGKIGRSMPLTLAGCGNLGGDVEMVAVVRELALRRPQDEFILMGRNSGERPEDVGLPTNVTNPWVEWGPQVRPALNAAGLNRGNFSVEQHHAVGKIIDDLVRETFDSLDHLILWIGQHGTTNSPLPAVMKIGTTKPQDAFAFYAAYLLRGINRWRDVDPVKREPIFLNADSRNYLKMRDMAWPLRHPVLTQMTYEHLIRNERGHRLLDITPDVEATFPSVHIIEKNGHKLWQSEVRNEYSRLEVNGLRPGTPFGDLITFDDTWEGRDHFGLFINEARAYVGEAVRRVNVMRDWVLPLEPTWVHGTWSEKSQETLGMRIVPTPWENYYPRLHATRSTFTTPSSGSGFATAKPWEAFAGGTVCFFHPAYDTQDNILGDAPEWLRGWLRVSTPFELRHRVAVMNTDRSSWQKVVHAQREHFDRAMRELTYVSRIEARLDGTSEE